MNGSALALVLTAAIVHAGWNLAAKRVRDGGAAFVFLYHAAGAVCRAPIAVAVAIGGHERPQWTWLLAATLTAIFHVLYGIVLQRGYAVGDLSVVYPLARGSGPLLAVFAAVLLFGERPGILGLMGALLVVAGVLLIGTGSDVVVSDGRARRAGAGYGLLTGVTIAAYRLWDDHAVNALGVPPVIYFGHRDPAAERVAGAGRVRPGRGASALAGVLAGSARRRRAFAGGLRARAVRDAAGTGEPGRARV